MMYIKFSPNQYVLRYKKGKLVAQGAGISFFFWAHNTSACALPISGTDIDFMFEETTQDFQTVTVQGQLTCRIADFEKAAAALDFTVNLRNGSYMDQPMEKLSKRMVNLAHVLVKSHIGAMGLTEAIQASRSLADQVLTELEHSEECAAIGVAVSGFSILKIRANPETARALEAKTREDILRESDDAIYARRNASIEQERKVKKFIMELESDNLCAINCLAGKVEFLDTIRDICIAEEIILIRTEDRDFRNGCLIAPFVKNNREENNVNAYDWAGNHLWNIGELVGDIKMAFDGISHITPAEAKREFGIKVKRNARCLFRCVAGGFVFVIDAESRKMLCKAAGRAK